MIRFEMCSKKKIEGSLYIMHGLKVFAKANITIARS